MDIKNKHLGQENLKNVVLSTFVVFFLFFSFSYSKGNSKLGISSYMSTEESNTIGINLWGNFLSEANTDRNTKTMLPSTFLGKDSKSFLAASSSDLKISKSKSGIGYYPGTYSVYTVVVENLGTSTVVDAKVNDLVPVGIPGNNVSFSAVASTGSSTTVIGTQVGAIDDLVTLPENGKVVYTITISVPFNFTGDLESTATIQAPSGTIDPDLSNNSTTVIDTLNTADFDCKFSGMNALTPNPSGVTVNHTFGTTKFSATYTTNAGGSARFESGYQPKGFFGSTLKVNSAGVVNGILTTTFSTPIYSLEMGYDDIDMSEEIQLDFYDINNVKIPTSVVQTALTNKSSRLTVTFPSSGGIFAKSTETVNRAGADTQIKLKFPENVGISRIVATAKNNTTGFCSLILVGGCVSDICANINDVVPVVKNLDVCKGQMTDLEEGLLSQVPLDYTVQWWETENREPGTRVDNFQHVPSGIYYVFFVHNVYDCINLVGTKVVVNELPVPVVTHDTPEINTFINNDFELSVVISGQTSFSWEYALADAPTDWKPLDNNTYTNTIVLTGSDLKISYAKEFLNGIRLRVKAINDLDCITYSEEILIEVKQGRLITNPMLPSKPLN